MPYTPPNYATNIPVGGSRRRIFRLTAENPVNGTRRLDGHEEEVTKLATGGERTIEPRTRDMSLVYTDALATQTLDLIHPDTDQKVGDMPFSQAYLVLHSLGRRLQKDADAREAARIAAEEAAAAPAP